MKEITQRMGPLDRDIEEALKNEVGENGLTAEHKVLLRALRRYGETGVLRNKDLRAILTEVMDIAKKRYDD